LRIGPGA